MHLNDKSMTGFIKSCIRSIFFFSPFEKFLAGRVKNKTLANFWVKLLPPNNSYKTNYLRKKCIDGINYQLDLRQWMEYVFYFGINIDNKHAMYQMIHSGMNVIDVGTNFGETLLNFATRCSPGFAIGFEPVPYISEKCITNILLNNFNNITFEQLALSDTKELLTVNDPNNNNSGGVFLSKGTGESQVNAISLDDYVSQHKINKIDLIKIDVEGFEMKVIHGGERTLKKYFPILIVEVIDVNLKKQNSSAFELINTIRNFGYNQITDLVTGEIYNEIPKLHNSDLVFRKN